MGYAAKLSLITSDVWNPYRWRWFQDFRKRHPEIYMDKGKMFSRKESETEKEQKESTNHMEKQVKPQNQIQQRSKSRLKSKSKPKRLQSPKHQKDAGRY